MDRVNRVENIKGVDGVNRVENINGIVSIGWKISRGVDRVKKGV